MQSKIRVLADDYFSSEIYANSDLIQLIDGEVYPSMPPIPRHQAIVGAIFYFLLTFARKKGGKAFTSPIELYLDEHNVYEPDALYLVPDSNCTVNDKRLVGAPELVVEVLSPSTAKYDRHQKFNAYEQHAVREYWIVDPANETVEVYTLADNTLNRQGVYNREDEFTSPVLAQTVSVADVFADV